MGVEQIQTAAEKMQRDRGTNTRDVYDDVIGIWHADVAKMQESARESVQYSFDCVVEIIERKLKLR
jgi:hypothetical protein